MDASSYCPTMKQCITLLRPPFYHLNEKTKIQKYQCKMHITLEENTRTCLLHIA